MSAGELYLAKSYTNLRWFLMLGTSVRCLLEFSFILTRCQNERQFLFNTSFRQHLYDVCTIFLQIRNFLREYTSSDQSSRHLHKFLRSWDDCVKGNVQMQATFYDIAINIGSRSVLDHSSVGSFRSMTRQTLKIQAKNRELFAAVGGRCC